MRLIDADALQKEYMYEYDGKRLVLIDTAPTIEERKNGRWIDDHGNEKKDGYGADCSVCGWWSEYLTDFCGNCGADMRGNDGKTESD